jgi:predicted ATPase
MVKDLQGFCSQMKEYGQNTSYYATLPYLQGCLCLMGKTNDPLRLTGEAMDEDQVHRIASETNNMTCLQNIWFFKALLAYFLGEFEQSFELAEKFRKTSDSVRAHVIYPAFVFYSGLIHLALAMKTKKRKYFAGARKDIKTLKG